MARVLSRLSYKSEYLFRTEGIQLKTDIFKMVFLKRTFNFDSDNINSLITYSDIAEYELPEGCGYATGGKVLPTINITEDLNLPGETHNYVFAEWGSLSWSAVGGSIGPVGHRVIYDDTLPEKFIICWDYWGQWWEDDGYIYDKCSIEIQGMGIYMVENPYFYY